MNNNLNEQQKLAIKTINGQVIVISCAGSGKTTVIVSRINEIIKTGISSEKILVITFTKEAALQMKQRYIEKFGESNVCFGTIHSLCFSILRQECNYTINNLVSEFEQWDFFKKVLKGKILNTDMNDFVKKLVTDISYVKNKEINPDEFIPETYRKDIFSDCFYKYDEYKKQINKLDFDDMLIKCRNLLKNNPSILSKWHNIFKYIMIDEFQDTNKIQADIFYMLAGSDSNICVVGDDDQSIYGFRAADSSIMLNFPKQYPNCKKIYLDTNYRSNKIIIEKAANLIKNNSIRFEKEFKSYKKEKGKINLIECTDNRNEAGILAKKILEYHSKGIDYNDMAVLYRTNSENQMPIGAFLCNNIPFTTNENIKDYHKDFIFEDIMAYYRLANGKELKGDLQRIINRPNRFLKSEMFKDIPFDLNKMLSKIKYLPNRTAIKATSNIYRLHSDITSLKGLSPEKFMEKLIWIIGYDRFIDDYSSFCQKDINQVRDNLDILMKESSKFETMEKWIAYSKFYAINLEKKKKDQSKDGVTFMSYHSSKGLEWKIVFLLNVNEGKCPYKKAISQKEIEEERRLFYVAMTRAKEELNIMYTYDSAKSRFIRETKIFNN